MQTLRLLAFGALIAPNAAIAARTPFSWDVAFGASQLAPNPTIQVPDGMQWIVEFASGVITQTEAPIVKLFQNPADPVGGPQALYLPPTQLDDRLFTYGGPVVARYEGTVVADRLGDFAELRPSISLIGYLTPSLAGDFNGDSRVDAADYTTYRDNLGGHTSPDDYAVWAAGYGMNDADTGMAVPEPATAGLLAVGLVAGRRRR